MCLRRGRRATGISVADEAVARFDLFKLKKAGDVKYITLKIDKSEVVLDEEFPFSLSMSDFLGKLDDTPKYILIDHQYQTNDGREADKIVLISWCVEGLGSLGVVWRAGNLAVGSRTRRRSRPRWSPLAPRKPSSPRSPASRSTST